MRFSATETEKDKLPKQKMQERKNFKTKLHFNPKKKMHKQFI